MYVRCYEQTEEVLDSRVITKADKILNAKVDLLEVVRILVLNRGCIHVILEELFGSPESCISTQCDNACATCFSQGI